jgi:hypothetical protein
VPCILRDVADIAQIAAHGRGCFGEGVLMAPRPPLLLDFADPALGIIAPVRTTLGRSVCVPTKYLIPA